MDNGEKIIEVKQKKYDFSEAKMHFFAAVFGLCIIYVNYEFIQRGWMSKSDQILFFLGVMIIIYMMMKRSTEDRAHPLITIYKNGIKSDLFWTSKNLFIPWTDIKEIRFPVAGIPPYRKCREFVFEVYDIEKYKKMMPWWQREFMGYGARLGKPRTTLFEVRLDLLDIPKAELETRLTETFQNYRAREV